MAPPRTRIPRSAARRPPAGRVPAGRAPARPARRSAGDLLIGLLAIAALAALTVGVPFALITVFGLPVPHAMPSLTLLTRQLDVPAILRVLSLLVWLAWLQLVWCVIAEIRAAVRNAGMPQRVPLAGGTQALVHRLVTTALLVFAATAALSPALAHPAPALSSHSAAGSGRPTSSAAPPRAQATSPGQPQNPGHPARPGQPASPGRPASPAHPARPGQPASPGRPASPGQPTSPGRPASPPRERHAAPPGPASPPHAVPSPSAGKLYVVKPPVGRFHESLWEIAQKYLGDGRRYREIFELNKDRVQPDGSQLTIASLIRPGWVLHMPGDAHGPGLEVIPPGGPGLEIITPGNSPSPAAGPAAASTAPASTAPASAQPAGAPPASASPRAPGNQRDGDHGRAAEQHHAREHTAPGGHARGAKHSRRGDHARPGEHSPSGQDSRPGDHRRAGKSGPAGARAPAHGSAVGDLLLPGQLTYPDELAAAALLASGILAALGRRRREQLWQRAFGRRVVGPPRQSALAESALRAGSHEPSARLLDHGLRYVSRAMTLTGRVPPAVVAAHLSHDHLDLWMAPADLGAPPPWTALDDGRVWRLPSTALARVDAVEPDDAPALFPGLVSIGTDGTGRVLVDLEAAHGVISVGGQQTMITAVLSSMALELATSRWSDPMHITLAGFGEDLTALAPDRITVVPSLDEGLAALEAHAIDVAEAMAAAGVSSVLEGRALGVSPNAWVPHYLISAVPPGPRDRSRLLALARIGGAAAASYVVAGDVPGASWAWEVTPEGRLLAGALGFDVQAQLVPVRQHEAVAGLFTAAARSEGVPLTPPDPHAVPPQQLEPGDSPPAGISILGPVSVRAPGVLEPDRVPLVTELVVYLATHPGGVHPNVLAAALWPRGVAAEIRDTAVARATEWLGADGIGRPHLAADASGRLRLGTGVRVDWLVFQALAGHAELAPAGSAEEADYLARALDLVRGELLDGRPPGRYAWLATDDLDYEVSARVADTAHRLGTLRLATGDPDGAMDAARAGLRLAFDDELLWRDLLRAAHQTGRGDLLRSVVDEVCARTARDETFLRMAPETESLIDELYPSWRSIVL